MLEYLGLSEFIQQAEKAVQKVGSRQARISLYEWTRSEVAQIRTGSSGESIRTTRRRKQTAGLVRAVLPS